MKKISKLFVLLGAALPLAAFSVTPDLPAQTNSAAKPSLDALFGDAVVAKGKGESGLGDEDFDKRIDMQLFGGETREQWNQKNVELVTIPVVLQRELNVNVTDDDVKKFYEDPANISSFEQPETVRASHILL